MKHLMTSFFCCSGKKSDYNFAGRTFLRLLCWEMDILKRLSGECGTAVCMPATWKMLKKGFGEKLSIVLVQKNTTYFKIHACWVLSSLYGTNTLSCPQWDYLFVSMGGSTHNGHILTNGPVERSPRHLHTCPIPLSLFSYFISSMVLCFKYVLVS